MNWLAYFPTLEAAPDLDHLKRIGLDRTWYGWDYEPDSLQGLEGVRCSKGPDDGHGWVGTLQPEIKESQCETRYYPDQQEWRPCFQNGGVTHWVGWYRDDPPGPKDLERPFRNFHAVLGQPYKLEDGNSWLIPRAKGREDRRTLPTMPAIDQKTGEMYRTKHPGCTDLFDIADAIYGWIVEDGETPSENDYTSWACTILQSQYRIDRSLIIYLGLFYNVELSICLEFIDWFAVSKEAKAVEDAKKKESTSSTTPRDTLSSGNMPEVVSSTMDTNQPMQIVSG